MKKLLPLLFFFTCFSCYDTDTSKVSESATPSQKESTSPSVSQDSTEKIIKRQQDLLNKVYELQEKNRDTSKSYVYFSCTVLDKTNKYIDLISSIFKIQKLDDDKIKSLKACLTDIIMKYYYPSSDIILVSHEYPTFRETNENRALRISARQIVLDDNCK